MERERSPYIQNKSRTVKEIMFVSTKKKKKYITWRRELNKFYICSFLLLRLSDFSLFLSSFLFETTNQTILTGSHQYVVRIVSNSIPYDPSTPSLSILHMSYLHNQNQQLRARQKLKKMSVCVFLNLCVKHGT